MTQLLIATRNRKKAGEILEMIGDLPFEFLSLDSLPAIGEASEDGKSFLENAVKKATFYARQSGRLTLADDSGLCVDYLGGRPGVFSARYAGADKDDVKNCLKVLRELEGIPEERRRAYFSCAIAVSEEVALVDVVEDQVHGRIGLEMKGSQGFGYDPIFFSSVHGVTFGELDPKIKNQISHRSRALGRVRGVLERYIEAGKS